MAQQDLLIRLVRALDAASVPYMLTGSLASSIRGRTIRRPKRPSALPLHRLRSGTTM